MKDLEKLKESYDNYKESPLNELAGDYEKIVNLVFNKDGIFKSLFSDKYPKDAKTTQAVLRKAGAMHDTIEKIERAYRVAFKEIANKNNLPMQRDNNFFSGLRIDSDFDKREFYHELEDLFKSKLRLHKGL